MRQDGEGQRGARIVPHVGIITRDDPEGVVAGRQIRIAGRTIERRSSDFFYWLEPIAKADLVGSAQAQRGKLEFKTLSARWNLQRRRRTCARDRRKGNFDG